jgi:5'-3' exonuclease
MSTDKKLEYIKLLDKLSETFGESEGQSPDEIRAELSEDGFDIDSAEAEMMRFQQDVAMAAKMQTMEEAKRQRENLAAKQKEIMDKIKSWTSEQIIEKIKGITNNEPDLVVAYRDLDREKDGDIEEIKAILIDIELANLLPEEDENGYK